MKSSVVFFATMLWVPVLASPAEVLAPTPASTIARRRLGAPLMDGRRLISDVQMMLVSQQYALQYGVEFEDSVSYQSKALQFVELTPNMTAWRLAQRYTLACIYYSTNEVMTSFSNEIFPGVVVPWVHKWADGAINSNGTPNTNECTWFGVVCDSSGNVLQLNLASNNMTGIIPSEIANLRYLEVLDLSKNYVFNNGYESTRWIGALSNLRVLNLGGTGFGNNGNGLPSGIAKLTKLTDLILSETLCHGNLDGALFSNLTSLVFLDLGALTFSSSFPKELKGLANLQFLFIDETDTRYTVESLFDGTGFPNLVELWIDRNPSLSGSIPSTISNYNKLESIGLNNCNLTGSLPSSLGQMSALKQLWASGNHLSGSIPNTLGSLSGLTRLFLNGNDLIGSMPSSICQKRNSTLKQLAADCSASNVDSPAIICPVGCCSCCGPQCGQ